MSRGSAQHTTAEELSALLNVSPRLGEMVRLLVLNEREILRVAVGHVALHFAQKQMKIDLHHALPRE